MKALSVKQKRILDYIQHFMEDNAYPPSIRDIVKACGISSTSVAAYNLNILEKHGLIRRRRDISRGIELLNSSPARMNRISVPVIGQIAAGKPIPVPDSDTWDVAASAETLEVPQELVRSKNDIFALRVKGFSMIDALIDDGDIVIIQQTRTVENGAMAAVWLKNEKQATLKKVFAGANRVRLQPANSQMDPIFVEPDNVEIQGKVVAVIRQLT